MISKLVKSSLVLILGVLVGYVLKQPKVISRKETVVEYKNENIPECFADKCPQYFSWDVDGDHLPESIVVIPTAMTQGAGKVLIIDNGQVVFDSGEKMGIWVERGENENEFYLIYKTEVNTTRSERILYVYKEGHFVIK